MLFNRKINNNPLNDPNPYRPICLAYFLLKTMGKLIIAKATETKDIALVEFLDVSGAFENVAFGSIIQLLCNSSISKMIANWVAYTLMTKEHPQSMATHCDLNDQRYTAIGHSYVANGSQKHVLMLGDIGND